MENPYYSLSPEECYNEAKYYYNREEYGKAIDYLDHAIENTDNYDLRDRCRELMSRCTEKNSEIEKYKIKANDEFESGVYLYNNVIRNSCDPIGTCINARFHFENARDYASKANLDDNFIKRCDEYIDSCCDWESDLRYGND